MIISEVIIWYWYNSLVHQTTVRLGFSPGLASTTVIMDFSIAQEGQNERLVHTWKSLKSAEIATALKNTEGTDTGRRKNDCIWERYWFEACWSDGQIVQYRKMIKMMMMS